MSAETIHGAIHQLNARISGSGVPEAARVAPEDLVVVYTIGIGNFSADKKYFTMNGTIYKLDGSQDGSWQGIVELAIPLAKVWEVPPPPPPPFNNPVPPVPSIPAQGYSKATWRFGDGGSVTVIGEVQFQAAKLQDHTTILWISCDQIMSKGGTGRYTNAQGLKVNGLAARTKEGVSLEDAKELDVKGLDVFRIVRQQYIAPPPPPPA